MNVTKNIKMPQYATAMGKGVFVGVTWQWQCTKCGYVYGNGSKPGPKQQSPCPSTATGNHIWKALN